MGMGVLCMWRVGTGTWCVVRGVHRVGSVCVWGGGGDTARQIGLYQVCT